ncbi:ABC transporter permease [Deinococcus sp.]|uniref:ABC transporter permease n=1 Tax=Deinococcus sp. TaxID=47478 RepID=UPI003CC5F774
MERAAVESVADLAPAAVQPAPKRPNALRLWLQSLVLPLLALAIFLVLWIVAVAVFHPPAYLYPTPVSMFVAIRDNWASLLESTLITLQGTVWSFLLSALLGGLIALVLSGIPLLYKALFPYTVIIQTIPIIAVAPIIIIWFGLGMPSIVACALLIAIFPVIANTTVGLRSTDASLRQLFMLYGATRWQTLIKLQLPFALPYFFAGLRIAAGASVVGAVVGEYMAGMGGNRGGLGFLIAETASRLQMSMLFSAALASALLGILFFMVIGAISNHFLKSWHESASN